MGGDEFFPDLLFYHLRLHRYVVVELKAGEFAPEHAGKMNFYLSAVDDLVRDPATEGVNEHGVGDSRRGPAAPAGRRDGQFIPG